MQSTNLSESFFDLSKHFV